MKNLRWVLAFFALAMTFSSVSQTMLTSTYVSSYASSYEQIWDIPRFNSTDRPLNNLFIFYFVFIPPGVEHWNLLVIAQLKDVKATGLLDVALLNVIAVTQRTSPTATEDIASLAGIVKEIAGASAIVTPRYDNRYEYWGLYSMWEKAMSQDTQQQEDSVFLYMHSKGMVNHGNMTEEKRAKSDGPLFKYVIEPWKDVLHHFKTNPEVNKAGFSLTRGGYIYFNYIWVRSSYVTRLEAPVERPLDTNRGGKGGKAAMNNVDRFYYEHWIAHLFDQPPSTMDGWSMILEEFHLGACFTLNGTKLAWRRAMHGNKTRLDDDGVFNCTKRPPVFLL